MNSEFYEILAATAAGEAPAWLATVVTTTGSTPARSGMKMIIRADGTIAGTIGGGELEKVVIEKVRAEHPAGAQRWGFDLGSRTGAEYTTAMACGGVEEVFIEPLHVGPPLVIFGGGHCGVALSRFAAWAGFVVTVVDSREEWSSAEKHPHAWRTVCLPYEGILDRLTIPEQAYLVIMTHGHASDGTVLRQVLAREWPYLGLIGSGKKVRELFDVLQKEGWSEARLSRVCAPIGLPIGSHTPEEIAVSIVAQMIAVRNGV